MGHHIIGILRQNKALQTAIGRRKHALAEFLFYNVALAIEHFFIDDELRHALAVGPQHRLKVSGGHLLKVIGAINPV